MDPTVIISLVVSIVVAIFASITAPLILAHRTEKMHREDRQADREWQEAQEAKRVAALDAVAEQAEQAKTDLLAANAQVAETAEVTNGKLDVIHGLVNSSLTAAMQDKLDALVTSRAMMQEVIDLKRAAGREPTAEALATIKATEAKIAETRAALNDRLRQTEAIEAKTEREREP